MTPVSPPTIFRRTLVNRTAKRNQEVVTEEVVFVTGKRSLSLVGKLLLPNDRFRAP